MVNSALASAGVTFKERIYTPFVTLCMFLSQVLDPDHSCRAAVARLIVWLAWIPTAPFRAKDFPAERPAFSGVLRKLI